MIKIKIYSIGKTKESWLQQALDEYLKRLQPIASIEFILAKSDEQLEQLAAKEEALICLDQNGKQFASEEFSDFLLNQIEKHNSRLAFVIGGAKGLSDIIKKDRILISLSKMTFTHQAVRFILVEQIYRAFEIGKGSNYHK